MTDGFCEEEEEGVPPVNVHDQEVGVFVLRSVNETEPPSQTVVGEPLNAATGATAQEWFVIAPGPQTLAMTLFACTKFPPARSSTPSERFDVPFEIA